MNGNRRSQAGASVWEGAEPLTLAEIGRTINVSRERVRQLEAQAINRSLRLLSSYQQAA